uniref:Pleckstrin homology domain containing N1 n=1 Tax=Nothoprocta perdicaria TaxID=30464 RepID=A0A8C6YZN7_NOTPE
MGNVACVPPAPGRLRVPPLTTSDFLSMLLAQNIPNQENQKENLDQRFPSLFKKGRRKTVVRNLGKIIHYSKVKFKFQHCQEVNDCYLELFQSYLYFQSMGSNGLTYQGLLPLRELNVCEIANVKGLEEHAFRITGPLLNPLIVFCPTEAELKQWLYHLEKQIQLNGGSLGLPLLSQRAAGSERAMDGVPGSWVPSFPFLPKEQHDRLLVLYPSTLVIVSEEHNSLYFKGWREGLHEDFLSETWTVVKSSSEGCHFTGRLINSIRVTCPSYDDYQEWLYCLKTAQFRNADSSLSESESFSGSRPLHVFAGSGRGSLTSDGRTNSWTSRGKAATLAHVSHAGGSLRAGPSCALVPESRALPEPLSPGYSQPLHVSDPLQSLGCIWERIPLWSRAS